MLATLQADFWTLVRDQGDAELACRHFVGDNRLSALERVRIYRNMYWWRQIDGLAAALPRVAAVLGERFYATAYAYLSAHPSSDGRLERLGLRFPEWLRAHADPQLQCLADLAALEWLRSETFLAPDAAAVAVLADVDPNTFATARLEFVDALLLRQLASDAETQWDRAEAPPYDLSGTALESPAWHAAWRRGFAVFHRRLASDEGQALERLRAGCTVGEACEAFMAAKDPTTRAFEVLGKWFQRTWIARVVPAMPSAGGAP